MKSIFVACLLSILMMGMAYAEGQQVVFVERLEDEVDYLSKWHFDVSGNAIAIEGETQLDILNSSGTLDTITWYRIQSKEPGKDVTIVRDGNKLRMKGTFKGKPFKRTSTISELPFFPSPAFSLRQFAKSDEEIIRFWVLRSDSMKPLKMVVKKVRTEVIELNGKEKEAVYMSFVPAGMLSMFWSGKLWFDPETGDCLLYKGDKPDGRGYSLELMLGEG